MVKESELVELSRKRDDFWPKQLSYVIIIPISGLFVLLFAYWTTYESIIWISGERLEIPIKQISKSDNGECYLFAEIDGLTLRREIRLNTFKAFEGKQSTKIIYWPSNPQKSIFLELSDSRSIFNFAVGLIVACIFFIGYIKKSISHYRLNPDHGA